MVMRMMCVVWALVAVVSNIGCAKAASPTSPFGRTWVGTLNDSARGAGTIRLSLTQEGSTLVGTLQTTTGGVVDRDGPVTGLVTGDRLAIYWSPAMALECGGGVTLSGTVAFTLISTPSGLTGTYAGFTCNGVVSGTAELRAG